MSAELLRVGTLEELKNKGCIVVRGAEHPIAVFFHRGQVRAVDNRCPHMGFPLSQGSVEDGILTCHWHHARFDLTSGCTFDPFADDVPTADVELRNGEVWVCDTCRSADPVAHAKRRLREGMEQNVWLVIAKSVIALLRGGVPVRDIVREGALFGATHRDGWSSGMTILAALANLAEQLPEEEKYLALYHGLTRVANDCENQVSRRDRHPLEGSDADYPTLKGWLRNWTRVRHRDAAERTLLTAIERNLPRPHIVDMLLSAVTDRYYADTGHALDFINKSLEMLDLIGWEHAREILPTVVRQLVSARGGEESSAWRHPIDLIALCESAFAQLPDLVAQGQARRFSGGSELSDKLLSDDPKQIIASLTNAIRSGARPTQLTKILCYAAAMRIARFGTANELGDWITALHTFTYCNSLHQSIASLSPSSGTPRGPACGRWKGRDEGDFAPHVLPSLDPIRGIFHGAISIYLDRFLNVPPAHLPGERDRLDDEPSNPAELLDKYLELLDTQQRVNPAARVVARYLSQKHPIEPLITTLARGVLREDADFHTFQMLEAAVKQSALWNDSPEAAHNIVALARYSAAHAPTQRAALQTAQIALKLDRGSSLHDDE